MFQNIHQFDPDENLQKLPIGTKPATLDSLQAMKDFKNLHKLNEEFLGAITAPTPKPSNDSG
jgi:hypothetical protein